MVLNVCCDSTLIEGVEVNKLFGTQMVKLTLKAVAYPGILCEGGGSTNSVEDRGNGDLEAVAP
jgi:hypothetical protein